MQDTSLACHRSQPRIMAARLHALIPGGEAARASAAPLNDEVVLVAAVPLPPAVIVTVGPGVAAVVDMAAYSAPTLVELTQVLGTAAAEPSTNFMAAHCHGGRLIGCFSLAPEAHGWDSLDTAPHLPRAGSSAAPHRGPPSPRCPARP